METIYSPDKTTKRQQSSISTSVEEAERKSTRKKDAGKAKTNGSSRLRTPQSLYFVCTDFEGIAKNKRIFKLSASTSTSDNWEDFLLKFELWANTEFRTTLFQHIEREIDMLIDYATGKRSLLPSSPASLPRNARDMHLSQMYDFWLEAVVSCEWLQYLVMVHCFDSAFEELKIRLNTKKMNAYRQCVMLGSLLFHCNQNGYYLTETLVSLPTIRLPHNFYRYFACEELDVRAAPPPKITRSLSSSPSTPTTTTTTTNLSSTMTEDVTSSREEEEEASGIQRHLHHHHLPLSLSLHVPLQTARDKIKSSLSVSGSKKDAWDVINTSFVTPVVLSSEITESERAIIAGTEVLPSFSLSHWQTELCKRLFGIDDDVLGLGLGNTVPMGALATECNVFIYDRRRELVRELVRNRLHNDKLDYSKRAWSKALDTYGKHVRTYESLKKMPAGHTPRSRSYLNNNGGNDGSGNNNKDESDSGKSKRRRLSRTNSIQKVCESLSNIKHSPRKLNNNYNNNGGTSSSSSPPHLMAMQPQPLLLPAATETTPLKLQYCRNNNDNDGTKVVESKSSSTDHVTSFEKKSKPIFTKNKRPGFFGRKSKSTSTLLETNRKNDNGNDNNNSTMSEESEEEHRRYILSLKTTSARELRKQDEGNSPLMAITSSPGGDNGILPSSVVTVTTKNQISRSSSWNRGLKLALPLTSSTHSSSKKQNKKMLKQDQSDEEKK